MQLMSAEEILHRLKSSAAETTLTTHRLRYIEKSAGSVNITSIMLEEICSCGISYKSNPWLFFLSFISAVASIAVLLVTGITYAWAGMVLAIIFLIAYFVSRSGIITVSSAGSSVNIRTTGISLDEQNQFIDDLELAKNRRYLRSNSF